MYIIQHFLDKTSNFVYIQSRKYTFVENTGQKKGNRNAAFTLSRLMLWGEEKWRTTFGEFQFQKRTGF